MFHISCILMGLLIVVYGIIRGFVIYKKVKIGQKMKKNEIEA